MDDAIEGLVIISLVLAVILGVVFFWTWVLMVMLGAGGIFWGFTQVMFPFGIVTAVVLSSGFGLAAK